MRRFLLEDCLSGCEVMIVVLIRGVIKSNQIKSYQIKSNQIKSNQIKSNL